MPLGALQHYTIEPSNLKKTVKFYCEVLGLKDGERPPLGFPGNWLYSGGVATVHHEAACGHGEGDEQFATTRRSRLGVDRHRGRRG